MEFFSLFPVAMAQDVAQAAEKTPSMVEMLVMPAVFLMIMYFLIIKPQQRKAKEQAALLTNLKAGDEVVTTGGIIGKVKSVADTYVTLEIANNTNVKLLKANVTAMTKAPAPAAQAVKA
jgi:preprotein translocase subunit YajC